MKHRLRLFTLVLLVLSFSAASKTVICAGKVDRISMHANDKLIIKLDSMNVGAVVCAFNEVWQVPGTGYKTSPEMCSAFLSMFMHAKASNLAISGLYFDGDNVPDTCSSWESWKNVNIRHLSY